MQAPARTNGRGSRPRRPRVRCSFRRKERRFVGDVQRNIEALLSEDRVFEPPDAFRADAIANDPNVYDRANADLEAFWAEQAERLSWSRPWDTVMEWNPPWVTWFEGRAAQRVLQLPGPPRRGGRRRQGRLLLGGRAGRHPHDHLPRPARRGVPARERAPEPRASRKGDRVSIYLGMVPELPDRDARVRADRRRRTRSCSAGSARSRSATGSTTPRPRC